MCVRVHVCSYVDWEDAAVFAGERLVLQLLVLAEETLLRVAELC